MTGLVCAKGEHIHTGVSGLLCDVISKHNLCVSTCIIYGQCLRFCSVYYVIRFA